MPEQEALSLFGGRADMYRRLTRRVREKLKVLSVGDALDLERALGLPTDTFHDILVDDKQVDIELFDTLEGALDLSIHDILGDPNFANADNERYWKAQATDKPLLVVACGGGGGRNEIPDNPIDLPSYVTLRAIGELYM